MLKNILIFTLFLVGFGLIIAIFWYEEMRFALPTQKPKNFVAKKLGTLVQFSDKINVGDNKKKHNKKFDIQKIDTQKIDNKPTLLHFFSAKCPCSRFNATHVKELLEKFGKKINFLAVIEAQDETEAQISLGHCGLDMDFVLDKNGKIADSCGVYATPQAVILDKNQHIYFRGNYNVARYCLDENTQFVRLALEAYLQQKPLPAFSLPTFQAYGCSLDSDEGL